MTKNPQHAWAQRPTRDRLRAVGRIAAQIAMHRTELLALSPRINATPAEIISSELLPLADACRYAVVGQRVEVAQVGSYRPG